MADTDFIVDGKVYELKFNFTAMQIVESFFGCSIPDLGAKKDPRAMLMLLYACLNKYDDLTLDDVAKLLDKWIEHEDNSIIGLMEIIKNKISEFGKTLERRK